jgi:hypothetical protein
LGLLAFVASLVVAFSSRLFYIKKIDDDWIFVAGLGKNFLALFKNEK